MAGKASIKVGDVFYTNEGCRCEVVEYINIRNVIVQFTDTGNTKKCQAVHLRTGEVKNVMHPSVYGVGYLGTEETVKKFKSYRVWWSMLSRCYDEKYQAKQPTYIGCSVIGEWLNYSNFKSWFDNNYIEGCQLDKDIKVKGNKIYSPDTCLFISQKLNKLLTNVNSKNTTGYTGVSYYKSKKKYVAYINTDDGNIHLGASNNAEEAYELYRIAFNKKLDEYKIEFPNVAIYLEQHKL